MTAPSSCCCRLRTRPRHLRTYRLRNNGLQRYGVRKYRLRRQAAARRLPARAEVLGLPKYLRLERKELLIWPDQITQLSILARVLNRNLGGAGIGERGADNHEHGYPRRRGTPAQTWRATTEEELRGSLDSRTNRLWISAAENVLTTMPPAPLAAGRVITRCITLLMSARPILAGGGCI